MPGYSMVSDQLIKISSSCRLPAAATAILLLLSFTATASAQQATTTNSAQCSNTWVTMLYLNVLGGVYTNSSSVSDCQAQCVAMTTCVGIDYDGAQRCWLINSTTPPKNDSTLTVTHYYLARGVNSCAGPSCQMAGVSAAWNLTQNSHVIGGMQTGDGNRTLCLTTCSLNVNCTGFNWDLTVTSGNCWVVLNNNPPQPASGVEYYQKICNQYVNGFQIATPFSIAAINAAGSNPFTFTTTTPGPTVFLLSQTTTTQSGRINSSPLVSGAGAGTGSSPARNEVTLSLFLLVVMTSRFLYSQYSSTA